MEMQMSVLLALFNLCVVVGLVGRFILGSQLWLSSGARVLTPQVVSIELAILALVEVAVCSWALYNYLLSVGVNDAIVRVRPMRPECDVFQEGAKYIVNGAIATLWR